MIDNKKKTILIIAALLMFLCVLCNTNTGGPKSSSGPVPATNTPRPASTPTGTPKQIPTPAPVRSINTLEPTGVPTVSQHNYIASGVWRCPDVLTDAVYIGSIASAKFHYLDCYHAKRIIATNRLCFIDRDAAIEFGYLPCGTCRP